MKSSTTFVFARIILVLALSTTTLLAQQKRGITPRKPAPAPPAAQAAEPDPTFDTLLADDSYKIYVEVRGVGQLVHSPAFNDLLEPLTKITGPSKQFSTLLNWLDAHADILSGSHLLVAGWPTQKGLPDIVMAIEFASPEEAQKFEPQLRRLMTTLVPVDPQKPEPTPASGAGQPLKNQAPQVQSQPAPAPLPYHLTHAGSLVLLSDKPFALRDLKPRNARLLAEDQNFVTAHSRFASESLFLYVDVKAIEKEEQDRRKRYEEENQRLIEQERNREKEEQATSSPEVTEPIVEATELPTPEEPPPPAANGTPTLTSPPQVQTQSATLSGQESGRDSSLMSTLSYSIFGGVFVGQPKWPDAVAAAL
ncbi:MAG TPA: hypothetical protein VHR36_13860, partial [Pyrinomonadaceae bacterium]|nr:hypothetical protein [Pyrinomonadaceae bacterium]